MNIQKILSNIFSAIAIIIVLLIIISAFPITGNYKIMVVQSGSMEPAIHTGSVVIVMPEENYKTGDVITFRNKSGKLESVTHRIVEIKKSALGNVFTTKGDANNANDTDPVFSGDVIGKVLFSVPYFGYAVAAAKTKFGFLAIIIIPAILIIYDEVKKIIDELKKTKSKNSEVPLIKQENEK